MDVASMLSELDDHGFEDTLTSRKVEILNDTISDVCSRMPWPFLETTNAALTVDQSTGQVTSPTDIKQVLVLVDTTTGTSLSPERMDVMTKAYSTQLAQGGNPYLYYFIGGQLYVYPIPSAPTLTLRYLKVHPTVDQSTTEAGILLPPRHHRVLVLGTLFKLYTMEDDTELAPVFQQQYEDRIARMTEDLMRMQYDRPDRIYVTDEYDDVDYFLMP